MTAGPRIAVTGATGQLGSELVRVFTAGGATVAGLSRPAFDLAADDAEAQLQEHAPSLVVNAAAWTDVDGCATDPARARLLNGTAAGRLAAAAQRMGARFVQVSTNEVFDGERQDAYAEDDEPDPVSPYGASKLDGERQVRAAAPDAIIVRTAWIFGGSRSFPTRILAAAQRAAADGKPLQVVADEIGNPTPARILADRIAAVALQDAPPPVLHLAGEPPVSRHAWATRILRDAGMEPPEPMALRDYVRASTPPRHAVLDTSLSRAIGLAPIAWEIQA